MGSKTAETQMNADKKKDFNLLFLLNPTTKILNSRLRVFFA